MFGYHAMSSSMFAAAERRDLSSAVAIRIILRLIGYGLIVSL